MRLGSLVIPPLILGAALVGYRSGRRQPAEEEQQAPPQAREGERVEPGPADDADRAALEAELRDLRRRLEEAGQAREKLEQRVAELEHELSERTERDLDREQRWLTFTRALASLPLPEGTDLPEKPLFALPVEASTPLDPGERLAQEQATRARERAQKACRDLNALLLSEHVFALDFLELGALHDGWAGPVVVRELDDRGRMVGTIAADRLRLEASRAGRSMTLVFEVGWRSRGGVRTPFGPPEEDGGERGGSLRIPLPGVDPAPWIETLPQLLGDEDLLPPSDDGRWNLVELRLTLDQRLRLDSPGGQWRLVALGGVVGGDIHDVQLAERDRQGHILRRLFADTLEVRRRGEGVELLLLDGVVERGGEKAPFLEGRMRIFLPDADPERWREAGVPGLSVPSR